MEIRKRMRHILDVKSTGEIWREKRIKDDSEVLRTYARLVKRKSIGEAGLGGEKAFSAECVGCEELSKQQELSECKQWVVEVSLRLGRWGRAKNTDTHTY